MDSGDLPGYLCPSALPAREQFTPKPSGDPAFWQAAQGREPLFCFLLRTLGGADRGMGRGTLLSEALKEGFRTTEQEIRDILLTLNRLGLVTVSRGRGGSRLSQRGYALYQALAQNAFPKIG